MATEPKIFYTTFSVDGDAQTITLTGGGEIRASSKHYFKARFAFVDGDSNAFLRLDHLTASFSPVPAERSRNGAYSVPLEETEGVYECEIPWEVLTRRGNVYVGVFAGDMLVTNEAIIRVTKAAPVLGSHSQPTESWWSRFSAALAAAVASLTTRINTKQDALIAGENITIDDNVISAQGGASVTPYDENPQMDGTANAGSSTKYARGDHRHPTDAALAGRIATIEGKEAGWNAKWGSGTIGEIPITALEATTQINIMRGANSVSYTAQTLTDAQKAQARTNIGAVSRSDIGAVFTIKGEVATYEELPASGNAVGDVYYVSSEFVGYIWLETTDNPSGYWEELGEPIDLSAYRTAVNQDAIDASLAAAIPSASSATPQALGTAAAGSSSDYARADHIHEMPTAADVGAEPAVTETTVSSAGAVTQALDAGKIYHFTGALTSLTLTFNVARSVPAQYHFDFTEGSTAFDPVLPSGVKLPDNHTWAADTHYEVDILNNYACVIGWAVTV